MDFQKFQVAAPLPLGSVVRFTSVGLVVSGILFLLWQRNPGIIEEDHVLEWIQAGLLGLAGIFHSGTWWKLRKNVLNWAVFGGLALLNVSFLAREIDIDAWGCPAISKPAEMVFRAALVILWLSYIRFILKNFRLLWQSVPQALGMQVIALTFIGCCFYLLSWPFEKELFQLPEDTLKFWGQLMQVHACLWLFFSSATRKSAPEGVSC